VHFSVRLLEEHGGMNSVQNVNEDFIWLFRFDFTEVLTHFLVKAAL